MAPTYGYSLPQRIDQRLQPIGVLPELTQDLHALLTADARWLTHTWAWRDLVPSITAALGGAPETIAPFADAWALMYAAIVRLDHLQDGDPVEMPAGATTPTTAVNLLLAYYVLATSLLDDLAPVVSAPREQRLRRLWSDTMLRTAGGQHADLGSPSPNPRKGNLDRYQQIAQAKTGSTFALAFGGIAALTVDDLKHIESCIAVGDLFGTLVQIQDDLLDAEQEPRAAIVFPAAFQVESSALGTQSETHTAAAFRSYLYPIYREHALAALEPWHAEARTAIVRIFDRTFAASESAASQA